LAEWYICNLSGSNLRWFEACGRNPVKSLPGIFFKHIPTDWSFNNLKQQGKVMMEKSGKSPKTKKTPKTKSFPIVGIGASAGGLEALESFFPNVPFDANIAFVVVQHLDPRQKSIMGSLLQKYTRM
jgi:chemotaxis response regulator CheB